MSAIASKMGLRGSAGAVSSGNRGQLWRNAGLATALIGLALALAITQDGFFSGQNMQVLSTQMLTIGIASVGMAALMISGNVDLSIGSMLALVAIVTAELAMKMNPIIACAIGLALACVLGLANGLMVWRISISPIIITLGTLTLYLGFAQVLSNGGYVTGLPEGFTKFGELTLLGVNAPVWAMIAIFLLGHLILSRTTIGRHIYAVGGNRDAAGLSGISVRRMFIGLFVVNAFLVGIAALLVTSRFDAASVQFGTSLELDVITAVILGGVAFTGGEGSLVGVALAVVFLTLLNASLVAFDVNPYMNDVAKGGVLLAAVALDQLTHDQRRRFQTMVALREYRAAGAQKGDET